MAFRGNCFKDKVEQLQKDLSNLGFRITRGAYGLHIEEIATGNDVYIYGDEITPEKIRDVPSENVVCYDYN